MRPGETQELRTQVLRAINELTLALLELETTTPNEPAIRQAINAAISKCAAVKAFLPAEPPKCT